MPRVDWFALILELERAGVTIPTIAERTGIPRETLRDWRNRGHEPNYRGGAALVQLWREATGNPTEAPPQGDRAMSAAQAKA